MGDRYFLYITCDCGHRDDFVYYAPTWGFNDWTCPECGKVIDLTEHSGISYEDASNLDLMQSITDALTGQPAIVAQQDEQRASNSPDAGSSPADGSSQQEV